MELDMMTYTAPPTENGTHAEDADLRQQLDAAERRVRELSTPLTVVPPTTAQAMPRRLVWVDMPEEYGQAGMRARYWVNFPRSLTVGIDLTVPDNMVGLLRQVVVEHNDWQDFDGNPFPPAHDPAFWTAIPAELLDVLAISLSDARQILPNSMALRGRS